MARDELAKRRHFREDARALKQKQTARTHLETGEHDMPPKGQRSFGEDTALMSVRLPVSIIADIDAHVVRLRRLKRWRIGRVDAMCDLLTRAFDAIAAEEAAHVPFTPAAVPATPPQEERCEESFPREAELDAGYNKLKATIKEENHKNAVPPLEPAASMPTPVSHQDTPEDTFTVDLDTNATEDDQAAELDTVSEEPQPTVQPKAVKPRQRASRKKARV